MWIMGPYTNELFNIYLKSNDDFIKMIIAEKCRPIFPRYTINPDHYYTS
jgi:hypothetical protein